MADFIIRFLFANLFISGIVGVLLLFKHMFRCVLTSRMQYNLWFLLLGLLVVPFIPFRLIGFGQIFLWLEKVKAISSTDAELIIEAAKNLNASNAIAPINDFALSVSRRTPSIVGTLLFGIWITGIFVMFLFLIKSRLRLSRLKKSALPLQSKEVRAVYNSCLRELGITTNIPIYSTAFLKSPVITGLFQPCIYLPIHVLSDFQAKEIRHLLLHELQHFKYKDALANALMNLAGVLYWFNPFVWYALKEMRCDREAACDTSVLKLLAKEDYKDYGSTLIHFAEKISLMPFPFAAGISGSMRQMKKRILNIASYEKPSVWRKRKGTAVFCAICVVLFGTAPLLSTYAAKESRYAWDVSIEKLSVVDLSAYFGKYEGSFVLYDMENDAWSVYDLEHATLRTAPDSTYKIYSALFGLEAGIITPENSLIAWDGTLYPFEAWNANQSLRSAMQSSVNWYFQELDRQLGVSAIRKYVHQIGYGNENVNADISSYWLQSSLKISPVEQVQLLTNLYQNRFGFSLENIDAVKSAICLSSSESGAFDGGHFYGKSGTGRVCGSDVNGWFIGYVETLDNTYFFAANIQSDANAAGANALEISLSVLGDMGVDIRY